MFAEVYPVKRSPRRFTAFDYKIPPELDITVGDLVKIPFKKSTLLGVVKSLSSSTSFKYVKSIESIVWKSACTENDITRIETIARNTIQSPCNYFHIIYRGYKPPKKTLEQLPDSSPLTYTTQEIASLKSSHQFRYANTHEQILSCISAIKNAEQQVLILLPQEELAEFFFEQLHTTGKGLLLTGKAKTTERRSIIHAWRTGACDFLVGTRLASLLPAKHIEKIIVIDPLAAEYDKLDQNPRYQSVHTCALLSKQYQSTITYAGFDAPIYMTERSQEPKVHTVHLRAKEEKTKTYCITKQLENALQETLSKNKQAILVHNKKGVATILQCSDCGESPLCGTCGSIPTIRANDLICGQCHTEMWIPKKCPSCMGENLREGGIGLERVSTLIQSHIPDATVGIFDAQHPYPDTSIVLVTELFFKHVRMFMKKRIGLIAELRADMHLFPTHINSFLDTRYKIFRSALIASDLRANCLIQLSNKELFYEILGRNYPDSEFNKRKSLALLPFCSQYKIEGLTVNQQQSIPNNLEKSVKDGIVRLRVPESAIHDAQAFLSTLPDSVIITNENQYYDSHTCSTSSK